MSTFGIPPGTPPSVPDEARPPAPPSSLDSASAAVAGSPALLRPAPRGPADPGTGTPGPTTSTPVPTPLPPPASPRGLVPPPEPLEADPFERLRTEAESCRKCGLCERRTRVVFGEGARRPRVVVVGEAPGAEEDASGRPFVGRSGQLLTRMLLAISLRREDVYICNVVKCRPPGNRTPSPAEAAACRPYLLEQLRLLAPELVLVLGTPAARAVLRTDQGITGIRGRLVTSPEGYLALPTFHPAYLLRNPSARREVWLDLQVAAKTLGLPLAGTRAASDDASEAEPDGPEGDGPTG